jgi:predicted PurR-regulated permease PerM
MSDKHTIEISTSTIFKGLAIILGLILVYMLRNILVMLFISVIIAAAVDSPIDWLTRHKIKRVFSVAIVYILLIAIFAFLIYLIVPPLAGQLVSLATELPDYLVGVQSKLQWLGGDFSHQTLQDLLLGLGQQLSLSVSNIFVATINIFGGIVSAFLVLVISIYLAVQEQGVKKFVLSIVSPKNKEYAASLVDRILSKLGAWMRGQLVLMAIIGAMVYIGLSLLKIKFALTLALLTGLLEIIPVIGPILSAVPGILFALLQSFGLAIVVAAFYYFVQELEKYLIVPLVMRRSLDMNPIAVIVAVLVGAELYGILGAILAIPVAAIISIIFSDLMERRKGSD